MVDYLPTEIEKKWQEQWERDGLYRAVMQPDRPKHYALTMLPYPSGNLHIGHWYAMVPSDARARYMRMKGFNVMFPMGFDAFGLPAENAAIKNNIHPSTWTYANIAYMRDQLKSMGTMIDWSREAISSDPAYYRWTQWFFLKMLENGLAYRKKAPVDWCPNCNTTLAREQVWGEDRHCERCRTPVIKKDLKQWFFKTTRYAQELLDFKKLDWPERVQTLQTNWIGRSEGMEILFKTVAGEDLIVFTTRPDTLWGVTFMVIAPEHPLVSKVTKKGRRREVDRYVAAAARKTEIQRNALEKEKEGVFTGSFAINPVTGRKIPIWIADYVLMGYGTGAIMAVPAHDQRDFCFARKYDLKIVPVIQVDGVIPDPETMTEAVPGRGAMVNSDALTGVPAEDAFQLTQELLTELGLGRLKTLYHLHDWLISRQRYWGAPIPVIHCRFCGIVPVPEKDLPVTLPEDIEWRPTGESPLKLHPEWKAAACPNCGEQAERDTDTMDTFVCSAWYHLRYLSPQCDEGPFSEEEYNYWMPVDTYTGGIEHATMHLIYTRFFHKACRDMGLLTHDEPMSQLFNQGIILGADSEKMSKSRGNVIDPGALIASHGVDIVRVYLMFFANWAQGGPWNPGGIAGVSRWLQRVWKLYTEDPESEREKPLVTSGELLRRMHQTIAKVGEDLDRFHFNTALAAMMELTNLLVRARPGFDPKTPPWTEASRDFLLLLAPFAPHLAEELWSRSDHQQSVHLQPWPTWDPNLAAEEMVTLVIQINGKLRDKLSIPADTSQEEIEKVALASAAVQRHLQGQPPAKIITVGNKLVNIVC